MNKIGDRHAVCLVRLVVLWGIVLMTTACAAYVAHPARAQQAASIDASGRCPEVRMPVGRGGAELRRPAASCYDVVALRVEFQPDTTRFTTGDGTFGGDLFGGLEPSVDPLPHDAAYFQAHLDFLEHYVGRVSDGRTVVRTHLIPEVVRVPERMGRYAPTGLHADSDEERAKLARLVHDAWTSADEQSNFDMSGFMPDRTALVLFHAGVGRDIELIGLTLDKTPEDLPSIYFDEQTLDRLGAAGATFNGFPVGHSMIVPRTETRRGTDFVANQPYLLELSINGMLAASFFNFLGAPDLFDVESGESAIGPFGLMDAQGIFAYGGLFPPEPMAWTKYYLGWTEPVDLTGSGPETVRLRAMSLPDASESARALISDAEYFLVENRFRDPERDGLTLRVWKDGAITEQHVENGDESFNNAVITGFVGGVVVGVDNYDWALPGGLDENDNELNGGILVWHVDERRMRRGLIENAVNVGTRRAVDLEEADGAQDIGFPSNNPFAPRADLGTPFDFFYRGNPVVVETTGGREIRLYRNRFGPDTFPSSETNAGGPSFIVLEEFSDPAAEMSVMYRRERVAGISPLGDPTLEALSGALADTGEGSKLYATDDYVVLYGGDSVAVAAWGRPALLGRGALAAAPVLFAGSELATLERTEEGFRIAFRNLDNGYTSTPGFIRLPEEVADMTPASPLVYASDEEVFHVLFGSPERTVHVYAARHGASVDPVQAGDPIGIATWEHPPLGVVPAVFREDGLVLGETVWSYTVGPEEAVGQPVMGSEPSGTVAAVPVTNRGEVVVLRPDGRTQRIQATAAARRFGEQGPLSRFPVLVDLDEDGRLDVLVGVGSHLFAFSQSGAVVADFPIELPAAAVGQPLVFEFEDADAWTVLTAAADGYLHAYDGAGRRADGFPLEVGEGISTTPLLRGDSLIATASNGSIKDWVLRPVGRIWWGSLYGSRTNGSLAADSAPDPEPLPDPRLIDAGETYNWPNPIEDGVTHLRIRTARDARVEVTIVDGGGSLIHEIDMGTVYAAVPTEAVWQAEEVQSGLYFARFTASTSDGARDTMLVKMAVIR